MPLYGNVEKSRMKARAPTIDKSQWKGERVICFVFSVVLHFKECFKQKIVW